MSVVYLLIFLLTKDGPVALMKPEPDIFTCQQELGNTATAADKDPTVLGWTVAKGACETLDIPRKS